MARVISKGYAWVICGSPKDPRITNISFSGEQGSKLKRVMRILTWANNVLVIGCRYRVDFDEPLIPDNIKENKLDADEYEVEKKLNVRSVRRPLMTKSFNRNLWAGK